MHDNSQQVLVLSGCIMSDIVFGGRSDIWSTNLGCASVGTPDIRPPPQTISYTYLLSRTDVVRTFWLSLTTGGGTKCGFV